MTVATERLRKIKKFNQLVAYLRDELDWPMDEYRFEDLTFDWDAEELGIDLKTAAKIQKIKQLRPLVSGQEWGIFFVKFEPKQLPIVALRRLLNKLVIKKRASAQTADSASWRMNDLLFVSQYGEGDERKITFAHFTEGSGGSLPTLKVLDWDEYDTVLKLQHVDEQLHKHLRWPDDESDHESWRSEWSEAFKLRPRQVIKTAKELATELAILCRNICDETKKILELETEKGPVRKLLLAFQQALIHDLKEDDFADMYAQTITYGLFSAAVSGTVADDSMGSTTYVDTERMVQMVPVTNPFLREMLQTFLSVGGRKGKLDFDELGVQEVVELLNDEKTDLNAVLRDFGNRGKGEDPVIHFYEDFLRQYDKKRKVERGVFYTPQPVVSYIVRGVHELLQTEFGLEDGLADTTTWGEMVERHKADGLEIPEGMQADDAFVQILDPATGTATFLVEVIDVIHQTMMNKWEDEAREKSEFLQAWNEYVPVHLLPRLHGYELMMAPYSIAHVKIGLKLSETGYLFSSRERARIYLTNTLEPRVEQMPLIGFEALSHEAAAVNKIKQNQRFTVVVGNPPYSNYGQLNKNTFISGLLEDYKLGLAEKKLNLDDDFIKFVRFSQFQLALSGIGIHGMITNNTYLDGLTHRRMRECIKESFPILQIVNLHGSSKKGEEAPDGSRDENVFDITVGVAIGLFSKLPTNGKSVVRYCDSWGNREDKARQLLNPSTGWEWTKLEPVPENFFFVPKDFSAEAEYNAGTVITEVFNIWQNGLKTDRDDLFFDFDENILEHRMKEFYSPTLKEGFRKKYRIVSSTSYDIESRRLTTRFSSSNVVRCLYRPFDVRWLYYSVGLTSRPAQKVMKHMLGGLNLGLIATRQTQDKWDVLVTDLLCGHKSCAAYDINSLFPLYSIELPNSLTSVSGTKGNSTTHKLHLNVSESYLERLANVLNLAQQGEHNLPLGLEPEDILQYAYAVFYSPEYRRRYAEFLRIEFPRLPFPGDVQLMMSLSQIGQQLVDLHLLNASMCNSLLPAFAGTAGAEVEEVTYTNGNVWIDKSQKMGFLDIPQEVWEFHVGGYQVCERWLKDRQARGGKNPSPGVKLTKDDIEHYQKIVVAIRETIRLMGEIDEVIEQHGGWPDAFVTEPIELTETPEASPDGQATFL